MRRSLLPVLAVAALALTGCASAETPSAQLSSTASATAPATAAPTSTTSPTPTPVPSATESEAAATPSPESEATCATVLTDEEYASLDEDGLTLNPEIFVLDDTMQSLIDDGGLACYWTRTSGDVRVWFAQAARTADEWDAQKQALLGEGWTELDGPVADAIQAPTDNDDDYIPAMSYRDGTAYYASYADLLGSVTALQ